MLQRNLLPTSPPLIMETAGSFETPVHIYQTTWRPSQKVVNFTVPSSKLQISDMEIVGSSKH
jgi:hypothetical protein